MPFVVLGPVTHDNLSGVSSDDHHSQAHTVAGHSDTTATGAELDTLTDGSEGDSLHIHSNALDAMLGALIYG